MKPEQKFWSLLKDHVPGHVNRIESSTSNGAPDVNYCFRGKDIWLELKAEINLLVVEQEVIQIPFGTKRLRDTQIIWHAKRAQQGGLVLVAIRDGDTIKLLQCQKMHQYICLMVMKKPWNWEIVEGHLKMEDDY